MAFIHKKGPATTEPWPKIASVAIAANSILGFDGSLGRVRQAVAGSLRLAGVSLRKVASTDDDYASTNSIPVIIPGEQDVFEADVTGTLTTAMVGEQFDVSANTDGTAQNVDVGATSTKVITVVGFISSSKALVKFNGNYVFANKAN